MRYVPVTGPAGTATSAAAGSDLLWKSSGSGHFKAPATEGPQEQSRRAW